MATDYITPALTTIFRPPSTCTKVVTYDGSFLWQGQMFETGDPNCYPASYSSARNKYYSPGVCPSGWYSASSVSGTGALVTIASEGNALCCPLGFQAIEPSNGPTTGNTIFCGSPVVGILTNVYSTSTHDVGPLPADYTTTTIAQDQIPFKPTVWAEVIQVRWQPSDTAVLSLQAQQASSLRSASSILVPTTSSLPNTALPSFGSTSFSPADSGSSLSTSNVSPSTTSAAVSASVATSLPIGAKIGIAVGAAIMALILILLPTCLFLQRRRKIRSQEAQNAHNPQHMHNWPERSHHEQFQQIRFDNKIELDARNSRVLPPYSKHAHNHDSRKEQFNVREVWHAELPG